MSDQSKTPHHERSGRAGPGKEPGPALTPDQARKKRQKRIMIVLIAAAAVMVAVTAVVLLYRRWVKKPDLPPPPVQSVEVQTSLPPDASAEPTIAIDAVQPKVGGERRSDAIYTILVFGADVTSGLNDTIMVATYDVSAQRATVMSIPRDTLINSSARPNINAKKINAAYTAYGGGERGLEGFKSEVAELVGFMPDYYVQIDWELVGDMVEAIGGVWFDIPYHMDYDDKDQDLHIHYDPGLQFLNGRQAMEVVRWRKNNWRSEYEHEGGGSDTGRLKVQHDFLKAVLEQTLQIKNITRIGQLIELFNSRVQSDLAVENMLWFAQEAVLGGLKVDDVEFCTMPHRGGSYYQFGRDWDFVYPIQSQLLTLINESLDPYVEQVTIRQLDLMSVAADGSLRSSTGRLADPALGLPPVRETGEPVESDPVQSDPVESGPVESGPVQTGAPPEQSRPVDPPADPSPAPTGADTDAG